MLVRGTLLAGLAVLLLALAPLARPDPVVAPTVVGVEVLPSKHLAVQVKINGKGPYRLIFDTGAPVMILGNQAALDAGLITKDTPDVALALFGAKGQFTAATVDVGAARAEKLPLMVMDHPTVALLAKGSGPLDGIVGHPFFARFRFSIDYQAKQIAFTPNGHVPEDLMETLIPKLLAARRTPPVLAPAAVWGLVVSHAEADAEPGVTVDEVRPGSAAATAGLKAGDRLLTVDGRWTDTVADCYQAAALVRPETKVPVVLRRDGKELHLVMVPRAGL